MDRTYRQKLGLKRWVKSNCIGTWVWATGTGKTRGAMMAIELLIKHNPHATILVSVPTRVLKEQWETQLISNGLISNCIVEVINTTIKRKTSYDLLVIDKNLSI